MDQTLLEKFKNKKLFNPADVKPLILDAGKYQTIIKSANWKPEVTNPDVYSLGIGFQVTDENDFKGDITYAYFPLLNEELGQRFRIAQVNYANLLTAIQVTELPFEDVKQLIGKEVEIVIKHSAKTAAGKVFANITEYRGVWK